MKQSLAPMDYYFYRRRLYTIRLVLEYGSRLQATALAEALEELRPRFPVLFSRLETGETGTLNFVSCPEPLPLLEREMPRDFAPRTPADLEFLLQPIDNLPGEALLRLTLGHAGESSFVAFSFSHILGDGFSFYGILHELSAHARRLGGAGLLQQAERGFLNPSRAGERAPSALLRLFQDTGYVHEAPDVTQPTRVDTHFIAHADLEAERRRAFRVEGLRVSPNDLIMAKLLKRYAAEIPLTTCGQLALRCPVDYRRLHPSGAVATMGNAVMDAVALFDPETFDSLSLGQVATRVREAIRAVEPTRIDAFLSCLEDLRREQGPEIFEEIGCPGLLVSNMSKMPFDGVDLGQGAPTKVHHAQQFARMALVLPAINGVEVRMTLPAR
jgi:hypothetical protein